MEEGKTKEIDALINCLDDLPHLMDKIKAETANTTRYSLTGPNYSYHVGMAMNGQDPNQRNAYQMQRMAFQAKKVLERLSTLPKSKSLTKKTVQENAATAKKTLLKYKKSGIDLNTFFKQYDTTKSGALTYKDFGDILLSMSTGIGREDAMFLARSIDQQKTGCINYNQLLDALDRVESSPAVIQVPGSERVESNNNRPQPHSTIRTYSYQDSETPALQISTQEERPRDISPMSMASTPTKKVKFFDESAARFDEPPQPTTRIISLDPRNTNSIEAETVPQKSVTQAILDQEFGSTGRRFYYNNPPNPAFSRLKQREAPYYVDMTLDEKKTIKARRRRSSSAPPRATTSANEGEVKAKTSLGEHLRLSSVDDSASARTDTSRTVSSSDIDPSNSASLRRALHHSRQGRSKSRDDSTATLPLENPVTMTRELITKRQQLLEDTNQLTLENNLIRQISGKYENLRHIMKQQDRSQSGMVNLQEFKRSLIRLGIQLSNAQMETLFANYLPPASNTTSGTAGDQPPLRSGSSLTAASQHFIYNDQSNQSFFNTSSINISEKEKVIRINTVLDRLASRAKSQAFQHVRQDVNVNGASLDTFLQENEELKISRKVLSHLHKISNPNRVFDALYPNHQGYLTVPELTKSLQTMGATIHPKEMEIITRDLPRGPRGEIAITTFHSSLSERMKSLAVANETRKKQYHQLHHQNPRYTQTFRSNFELGMTGTECLQPQEGKGHSLNTFFTQKEKREWGLLQSNLQKNYEKVLEACTDPSTSVHPLDRNRNVEKRDMIRNTVSEHQIANLSIEQLQKRFAKQGLFLGKEDTERLQKQLYQKLYQERRLPSSGDNSNNSTNPVEVSMEDFCDVVGIPIRKNDNLGRVELMDRYEARLSDVGVFESSKHSVAHPATSASIFLENDQTVREKYFGKPLRKPPQPLGMYSKDPSKFWEMAKSNDNPLAFAYPLPTTRPTAPPVSSNTATAATGINHKAVKRGIISKDDSSLPYHGPPLTMEALLKANNQPINRVVTNDGSFLIQGGAKAVRGGGGGGGGIRNPLQQSTNSQHSINFEDHNASRDPINRLTDTMNPNASHFSAPEGLSPIVASSAEMDRRSRHQQNHHKKRSVSVDPRLAATRSHEHDPDGASSQTGSVISRSSVSSNASSTRRGLDANDLSAQIARWSNNNNTLADYYNKAMAEGTGPAILVKSPVGGGRGPKRSTIDHYDSQDSTISPNSYHSASTISRGTVSFNKKPVAIMGGGGKKSVREDFDSSAAIKTGAAAAPYATDSSVR